MRGGATHHTLRYRSAQSLGHTSPTRPVTGSVDAVFSASVLPTVVEMLDAGRNLSSGRYVVHGDVVLWSPSTRVLLPPLYGLLMEYDERLAEQSVEGSREPISTCDVNDGPLVGYFSVHAGAETLSFFLLRPSDFACRLPLGPLSPDDVSPLVRFVELRVPVGLRVARQSTLPRMQGRREPLQEYTPGSSSLATCCEVFGGGDGCGGQADTDCVIDEVFREGVSTEMDMDRGRGRSLLSDGMWRDLVQSFMWAHFKVGGTVAAVGTLPTVD